MQKFKGFELEDQPWLPSSVRNGMTDYLRFLFTSLNMYSPVIPLLKDAISESQAEKVIDLCSGSGGAVELIQKELSRRYNLNVEFVLTDLFPNQAASEYFSKCKPGKISYFVDPVDADKVPKELKGLRTIFSGFHHFDRSNAGYVLKNAVVSQQGIAIFDGSDKNLMIILFIVIFHPLFLLLFTPFIQPFRWSRLFWVYILPLIPIAVIWDGIASIISLYKLPELKEMAVENFSSGYRWKCGRIRNKLGLGINFLIAIPDSCLQ